LLLAAGTDGTDGPTDATGAIAHGQTTKDAEKKGIDAQKYLDNNDAYNFFSQNGDIIRTGPTGTNVMDMTVVLIDETS
jgi:glycerate-2-kinase